jgi:GntR family transcriptional repressor for pyruvate dehydrogenase complex
MRSLLADIVRGTLAPESEALREADIVERFGVSRGVARECVRGLEERGLVSVKPGRGATVNPPDRWAVFDDDVVSALLGAGRDRELLGEYLECRRILEVEAVALAAVRAEDNDVATLRAALDRMEIAARRAALNRTAEDLCRGAEGTFHAAIVAATHNGALAAMVAPLWRAFAAVHRSAPGKPLEPSFTTQRRIVDAIAHGDAGEARAAMRDHLLALEHELGGDMPERPGAAEHRAA